MRQYLAAISWVLYALAAYVVFAIAMGIALAVMLVLAIVGCLDGVTRRLSDLMGRLNK